MTKAPRPSLSEISSRTNIGMVSNHDVSATPDIREKDNVIANDTIVAM